MRIFKLALALSITGAIALASQSCSKDEGSEGDGGSAGSKNGGKGGTSGGGGKGGTSGGGGKGGGMADGPGAQKPDGEDAAAWKKFLQAGEFRKGGWVSESAAIRLKKGISPHGRVRVWMNEKLKAAQGVNPAVYEAGSVIVKEMFGPTGEENQGYVAFWKLKDGSNSEAGAWLAYCQGDKDRCLQTSRDPSLEKPILGDLSKVSECLGCHHGGSNASTGPIYTKAPRD